MIPEIEKNTGVISINDLYKIEEKSDNILEEPFCQWNPRRGMKIFQADIMVRRSNFHGHEFRLFLVSSKHLAVFFAL